MPVPPLRQVFHSQDKAPDAVLRPGCSGRPDLQGPEPGRWQSTILLWNAEDGKQRPELEDAREAVWNWLAMATAARDGYLAGAVSQEEALRVICGEQETKELLIQLEQDYPGTATTDNVDDIAANLQQKTNRASVLAKLRQLQAQADQSDQPQQHKKDYDQER